MVNAQLSSSSWMELAIPGNNDLTAIQISTPTCNLTIVNIYNDNRHMDSISHLKRFLRRERRRILATEDDQIIWAGDFNSHHPLWDRDEDHRLFTAEATRRADKIIAIAADENMQMALPKGIPTIRHFVNKRYTRPDNVWCTEGLLERIVRCDVDGFLQPPGTDHFPIVTIVDIPQSRTTAPPSLNFRMTDWKEFKTLLTTKITELPEPGIIQTKEELQETATALTTAIQLTIEAIVPINKPCPNSKRWWNRELSDIRKAMNKLSRTSYRYRAIPDHPSHTEHTEKAKEYGKAMDKAKIQHWREFLEDAVTKDIWTANRYISTPATDGGKSRIPTLKQKTETGQTKELTTNEDKAGALATAFFPPKPDISTVPNNYEYPNPLPPPPTVTLSRIRDHIARLSPYKACGPDHIPNVVLQQSVELIEEHLLQIYRATFTLNAYVDSWREFTTVVLRKPGKPSYEVTKAYRPIALICTMAKVLTSIVADDISRIAEREQLLPTNHYGGRSGRMTTDAVHMLEDRIKTAWRNNKIVSVLYLDVEGAFPNAVTDRLLHNLKKRRIPRIYVDFVENLLKDRRTKLRFDNFTSEQILISNGIGQGDPLSMILYIIYNADLLEITRALANNTDPTEDAIGFVDDAMIIVTGKTLRDNVKTLTNIMEKPNGGFAWAKDHNSKFEIDKLAVVHHTRKTIKDPRRPGKMKRQKAPPLILQGKVVKDVESYKYLGIHVDRTLRWKTQLQKTIAKSTTWMLQFRRLSNSAGGLQAKLMRRLYISVAIPKMTYGLDVWYTPPHHVEGRTRKTGSTGALKEFTKLQRIATLAITGALRTTPTELLDPHAGVLPTDLMLRKTCHRAMVRLSTLPDENPAAALLSKYHNKKAKTHVTSLQLLLQTFNYDPTKTEQIQPRRNNQEDHPDYATHIANTPDAAIKDEKNDKALTRIYTDGSSTDGMVGASAVLYDAGRDRPRQTLRYQLGPDEEYSTDDAEAVGITLGCWMMRNSRRLGKLTTS
ncbi:hypothetical protein CVT25_002395, partial [Psilocybe cyanescens]